MKKIFIDGSSGTTGLRIRERLAEREDLELIILPDNLRKEEAAITEAMQKSDVTFLCLPDDAARRAAELAEASDCVIIDTSTAHRTAPGWAYGFPELKGLRDAISGSKRIANPGCHASGFISLIAPLTEAGVIDSKETLSCFSLTGYSGGGKKMIAEYEGKSTDGLGAPENGAVSEILKSPGMYALGQTHKHLPEMVKYSHLECAPLFCPIVADFYCGMEVVVPLSGRQAKAGPDEIKEIYKDYYREGVVSYKDDASENGFLYAGKYSGRDDMEISVYGNEERIILVSRFDNLGKGASGAAIQNMNIALGLDETEGLVF